MRAVRQAVFGEPDALKLVDYPDPVPLPTEILVRVKASAVNPVDGYVRSGAFPMLGQPPFILGWDVSGVVEGLEPGVNRFAVGDEVYGMPLFPRAANGYAELVAAPSRHFAAKPKSLDHIHAAALPLVGLTAWQSLVDVARIAPGQRVLIQAGAGGVGHVAVQIAKAKGAYVITTASTAKHDFVRSLGADEVIDYRKADFAETVKGVDIVLETVGGETAERSLRTLKFGGLFVTIVDRRNEALAAKTRQAGLKFAGVTVEPDYLALDELTRLVDQGKLRVHVEKTFPLAEAAAAHRFLETKPQGKIVLIP